MRMKNDDTVTEVVKLALILAAIVAAVTVPLSPIL